MKNIWILFVVCFILFSCSMPTGSSSESGEQTLVSVINWNLQTFFDSKTVGTEYDDFQGSKTKWNKDLYIQRVKTLCAFIENTQSDIYVFQEIENSGILQDLINELSPGKKKYAYSAFSKQKEDALGLAILSCYPLENINAHQLDFQVALGLNDFVTSETVLDGALLEQPSLRGFLHAQVIIEEEKKFSIYACHWKSKYGGAEKSEVWRNAQEMVLADILVQNQNPVLVAGDFNRTLEEFLLGEELYEEGDTSFFLQGSQCFVEVVSPWLEYENKTSTPGSYYYQNQWEKIDHFLYTPSLEVVDFQTLATDETVSADGTPLRFNLYSGQGASDHLPLLCVVEL